MRNYRTLTAEELSEIEQLYPVTPNREIVRRYDISLDALTDYIAKPRGWRKDMKAIAANKQKSNTLTEKELNWFIRHYSHTKNADIMQRLGIGESMLHRLARKHGLRKSDRYMRKVQAEITEAARQVCVDYGVYEESGRRLSREWSEHKARGERMPHSFQPGVTNMQRLGSKREQQRIENATLKRNETIRKEKLRLKYGLERKTRLPILIGSRYTHSQLNHRYHAINRGYILADDTSEAGGHRYVIYYDDQTPRSPKFERNLIADGFTLCQWPE